MRASGERFRYSIPRRRAIIMACLLAISGLVMASAGQASAAVSASWTGWLNTDLETYADNIGAWNSGDNGVQVALPGGQALWLWNDSFVGPVRSDGTEDPFSVYYDHNTELLTTGSGSSFTVNNTITGPVTNGRPTPAVPPISGSPSGSWAWPAGGLYQGSSVEAIYNVFAQAPGLGDLNYAPVSNEIVTMPLSSLTDPSTYSIVAGPSSGCSISSSPPEQNCVQWGVGMLNSTDCPAATQLASCTYVYGEKWPSYGSNGHTLVEAVTPQGGLGTAGDWWYDTTSGWSQTMSGLSAQLGGASVNAVSVHQVSGSSYVAVESTGGGVVAYYSSSPQLTNASSAKLFNQPSGPQSPLKNGAITYQFHIEPAYSSGSNVVMGFSVNSGAYDKACLQYAPYVDAAYYQPEFYSFTLPASASAVATGTLPAPQLDTFPQSSVSGETTVSGCTSKSPPAPVTPGNVTAAYAGGGNINLSWKDPGGLFQYDIRREDLDNPGWTQFQYPVWDSPCASDHSKNCFTDSASFAGLIPGHSYDYEFDTYNWVGHGIGWNDSVVVTLPAKLTVVSSGLCDSVPGGSTSAGTQFDQEGCAPSSSAQQWRYTATGQDPTGQYTEYEIANMNSGYCMVPAGSQSGAAVDQEACSGSTAQWEFRIVDTNYDFQLYNVGTGLCLSPVGGSQSGNVKLVQAACGTTANVTWHSSLDY
jgi:hypothetical protein